MSSNLTTGVICSDLAALDAGKAPPAEIKITPAGRVTTRDGRSYSFDPVALATRFRSDGIDIPVDLDHAISRRTVIGERADAIGWVKSMSARPDGLYAAVDWLDSGKTVIAARSHRFVSPTFKDDADGNAIWVHSVALVAAPALPMAAVADAAGAGRLVALGSVAGALGLPAAADEKAVLAEIARIKARTGSTLENLASAVTQVNEQSNALRQHHVETKVDGHIRRGCFTPAMRDWALRLCSTDEASFDEFVSKIGTPLAHLFSSPITAEMERKLVESMTRESQDRGATSDATDKIARQLGINPDRLR